MTLEEVIYLLQKGLDRPELREKIERLEINFCFALLAFDAGHISKDEMDLYRDYLLDQILALIPDIEELDKIRDEITKLNKKLDDREEDLIEAKKQGIVELLNWLKEYAIHGSKMPLEDVLIDIQAHSPYGQALKEEK